MHAKPLNNCPLEKATQHTVTFIPGEGATFNDTTSVKVDDGAKVTKPSDPTKAGYTFAGWFKDETTKWNFDKDTVTSDVTLTAHWTKITQPPTPPTPPTPTPGTEGTGDPEDPGNPEDPYTPGTPGDTKPDTHKTQPQIEFNVDPQITPQLGQNIAPQTKPGTAPHATTADDVKNANASSASKFLPRTGNDSSAYAGIMGCLSALAALFIGLTVSAKRRYSNAQ